MAKTYGAIKTVSDQIKNATTAASNTAAIVGGNLGDIVDKIQEVDGAKVPKTTTVNGKPLSGDITLDATDIGVATDLADKVSKTATETIGGTKTFSVSPIIPTPDSDMEAATKKYVDDSTVGISGNETIIGVKTFQSSPIVPAPTTDLQAATKKYVDDSTVGISGNETIAGIKTFQSSPIVPTPTTDTQATTKKYVDDADALLRADLNHELESKILPKTNLISIDDAEDSFYVTDSEGNIIAVINSNGLRTTEQYYKYADKFYITDNRGNVIFKADSIGIDYLGKKDKQILSNIVDNGNYQADIVMNIIYGQSLSVRGSIVSGTNMYNTLSFKNGVFVNYTDVDNASVVNDWYGSNFINTMTDGVATPVKYMNRKYMELLRDENGIDIEIKNGIEPNFDFQLVGSVPGDGGLSWSQMIQTTGIYYKRLIQSVTYAKKFAEQNNKTFKVGCLGWMQGENSNEKYDSFKTAYDKLWIAFSNLNHDIKLITGQPEDVQFIPYQLASHVADTILPQGATDGTPLAALQISLDKGDGANYTLDSSVASMLISDLINRNNIHIGPILYPLDVSSISDHIHQSDSSVSAAGSQFGIQAKRVLYDNKPITPVYPISHNVILREDGKYILSIKFNVPIKPLVFDIDGITLQNMRGAQQNYGFSILNTPPNNFLGMIAFDSVAPTPSVSGYYKFKTSGSCSWITGSPIVNLLDEVYVENNGGLFSYTLSSELIESVSLRHGDSVNILCSNNPTGFLLNYAKTGIEGGGNLRDSQGDYITSQIGSITYKCHNWAPILKITI